MSETSATTPALQTTVFSQARAEVGTVALPPAVFAEPLRRALLADVVRMQTASRRAGTASTKEKGDVRGGGKKPWKQKGTGRARAGSIRSPLWPGGGTIFGPHPRDYGYRMPKRARKAALRSALAQKLREERLTIVDRIELPEPKTKHVAAVLRALGIDDSVLIVIPAADERLERAGRNLPRVKVLRAAGLNVYDLLRYHHLVLTEAALQAITARVAA
jgi:large subunit ribosomal protein L4